MAYRTGGGIRVPNRGTEILAVRYLSAGAATGELPWAGTILASPANWVVVNLLPR